MFFDAFMLYTISKGTKSKICIIPVIYLYVKPLGPQFHINCGWEHFLYPYLTQETVNLKWVNLFISLSNTSKLRPHPFTKWQEILPFQWLSLFQLSLTATIHNFEAMKSSSDCSMLINIIKWITPIYNALLIFHGLTLTICFLFADSIKVQVKLFLTVLLWSRASPDC